VRFELDWLAQFGESVEAALHNAPQVLLLEEARLSGTGSDFFLQRDAREFVYEVKLIGARTEVSFDSTLHLDQVEQVFSRRTVLACLILFECLLVLVLIHETHFLEQIALFGGTVPQ
jgi:hypothetical protein